MEDLGRIKSNVAKMASMGAPVAEIDGYISAEGHTVEAVRNYTAPVMGEMQGPSIPSKQGQEMSPISSTFEGVANFATGSLYDEASAGIAAGIEKAMGNDKGYVDLYRQGRDLLRNRQDLAAEQHPYAYGAGALIGGLPLGGALSSAAAEQALTAGGRIAQGALAGTKAGAGFGALQGAGESRANLVPDQEIEGEKFLTDVGGSSVFGAVTGGILGTALQGGVEIGRWGFDKVKNLIGASKASDLSDAEKVVLHAMQRDRVTLDDIKNGLADNQGSGIRRTLGETVNSPTLVAYQKVISQGTGAGAKDLQKFGADRFSNDIAEAVDNLSSRISSNSGLDEAGKKVAEAAGSVVKTARRQRFEKATPFYQRAFKNDMPEEAFSQIAKDPIFEAALSKVRNDPLYQGKLGDLPDNNFEVLQRVKEVMDDMASGAEGKAAGYVRDVQKSMLKMMNAISPDYAKGRSIWQEESMAIKGLTDAKVGILADLDASNYRLAAQKVFQDTPRGLLKTRQAIESADPDAWNSLMAAHINEIFRTKSAGDFKNALFGGGRASMWKSAVDQDAYEGMNRLASVLDSIAKAGNLGSDAMPKSEAAVELANATLSGKAGKLLAPRESLRQWLTQREVQGQRSQLADIFINPDIGKLADQLRDVQANSPQAARIVSKWLGQISGQGQAQQTIEDRKTSGSQSGRLKININQYGGVER